MMPNPAATTANRVNGQKYFFTIVFACSWNRHNNAPNMANRSVRNIAVTPINKIGLNVRNPAHIANNLYGTCVNAAKNMINRPCFANNERAISKFSILENVVISHVPIDSNNQNPIIYAIIPPTNDPKDVTMTTGNAFFLFATIVGVINTSGGRNKNIDSQTVSQNITHKAAGLSHCLRI